MPQASATTATVTRTGVLGAGLLSLIAYTDEDNPAGQRAAMIAQLGSIGASVNGPWTLMWGPSTNNGILAYIARGEDGTHALAIRGTVNTEALGFFSNVIDDGDVEDLVPFLYPQGTQTDPPMIAPGSNMALSSLIAMTDPQHDTSIIDFLRSAAAFGDIRVMVAGHSLGADLATLASAWLYDQLPKAGGSSQYAITPYTFAAPTTGNAVFAKLWNNVFGTASYAAVNTDDIVPMAWNNFASALDTYEPQGGTGQQILSNYAEVTHFLLSGLVSPVDALSFTPVTPSQLDTFAGPPIPPDPTLFPDWPSVVQNQHGLETAYLPHIWFGWTGDTSADPPKD